MSQVPLDVIECECTACQSACLKKPGWFKPGQVEEVAAALGVSLQELFKRYLMVDYVVGEGGAHIDTFVLSPATINGPKGKEASIVPTGQCVFYTNDGKCAIHPVKPWECRSWDHRQGYGDGGHHKAVTQSWAAEQQQIADLLGRKPYVDLSAPAAIKQFNEANTDDLALYLLNLSDAADCMCIINMLSIPKALEVVIKLNDLMQLRAELAADEERKEG